MTNLSSLKVPCALRGIAVALNCLLLSGVGAAQPASPLKSVHTGETVDHGKFVLHKFAQAIGTENYQIRKVGRSFQLTSSFEFTDRGDAVPLTAKLKFASDLTPEQFEVKGKNSRFNPLDDSVFVDGGHIHVRQGQAERDERRSRQFFTISGYAPAAMQMMLLR